MSWFSETAASMTNGQLNDFGEQSMPMPSVQRQWWSPLVDFAQERILSNNPDIINDDGSVNWMEYGKAGLEGLVRGPLTGGTNLDIAMSVYDGSVDAVNTVVGSTVGAAYGLTTAAAGGFDWSKSSMPTFRDGRISWDEISEMYNPFENDTTLGQQITTGMSRLIGNSFLTATGIAAGENAQNTIETAMAQYVEKQNLEAEADPENVNKLGSWTQIFDYNFDQYDRWQRESAFETMGPTKFISGALDFTWQAYAAPEVILAKGFSAAKYANSTMKFSTAEGRAVARRELVEHNMWRMSGGTVGRQTSTGMLAESMARMSPRQVRKHQLAIRSSNPELVANVLGQIDNPRDAGDAILALSGDRTAMANFQIKHPALADKIRYQQEQVDTLKAEIDDMDSTLKAWEEDATGIDNPLAPDVGPDNVRQAFRHWVSNQAAVRAAAVRNDISLKAGEVKTLQASLDDALEKVDGLRAASTIDAAILRDTPLARYQITAAERKAIKSAARQSGDWAEFAFKIPGGRPVRVIRSMAQKVTGTYRATGQVHVTDDREFYAEIDSVLNNNPAYRKAALAPEGSPERMLRIHRFETTEAGRTREVVDEVDAVEFRKRMMNEALSMTPGKDGKSLAKQRWEFSQDLEKVLFFDLLDRYGVSRTRALEVFENFKYMRNQVATQIKERGWVKQDGEIVLVPDLQSQVEETYYMLDLNFIETVLRLDRSGVGKRAFSGGRRGFNEVARVFDMFWRPLALMRLGYTQRNVAEGWLRTLAAYGSIATMSDLSTGTGNFLTNMGWRFASAKNGVVSTVRREGSVKRLREEMANDTGFMKEKDAAAAKLTEEVGGYDRRIAAQRAKIEKMVTGAVRTELSQDWRAGESVVWDDVTSDASAKIGEDWLDYADEFWVDPANATQFGNIGFDNLFDVTRIGATRVGGTPMLASSELTGLSRSQTKRLDEIAVYGEDGVLRLSDPKYLDEYRSLWVDSHLAQAEQYSANGDVLVMWNRDGTYSRVRDAKSVFESASNSIALDGDALIVDIMSNPAIANLAVLPKGTQVKAVRSTVYGRTLDLRNTVQEEWSDVIDFLRGGVRRKDLVGPSGRRVTKTGSVVRQVHALLFDKKPTGKSVQDVTWKQVKDLEGILAIMDEDPEFAKAIYAKMWVASLPKPVAKALRDQGLIVPSSAISRALSDRIGGLRSAQGKVEAEAEDIRVTLADEAKYVRNMVFHGGRRVEDDMLFDDPVLNESTMNSLVGPGYYTTANGTIAGEYLVGKPGALGVAPWGKAVEESFKTGDEPILYQTAAPNADSFLDLDRPLRFPEPDADPSEVVTPAVARALREQQDILDSVYDAADEINGSAISANYDEIYESVSARVADQSFALDPMLQDRTAGANMRDLMFSTVDVLMRNGLTEEQAWDAWITGLRSQGAKGVRHVGGRNLGDTEHDVFVWYEAPDVERLDEVSDLGLRTLELYRKFQDYGKRITRTEMLRDNADAMRSENITGVRNLYGPETPIPAALGQVDAIGVDRLTKIARELGYGKVLVDSPTTVEGYTTTYLHDMVSANRGMSDPISRAVPDYIYESFTADVNAAGEVVQRPLLDFAKSAESPLVPAKERVLMEKARTPQAAGASRFTTQERSMLIQMLEESGNTHVSVLHEGGRVSYLTKSQLLRSRKVADEFMSMTRGDEIKARVEQILSKDDAYVRLQAKRAEAAQQLTDTQAEVAQIQNRLRATAEQVAKRTKKNTKKRLGTGVQAHRGIVYADAFNEQYQGAYAMNQSSSAATNARDIVGYTDDMTRSMRRTFEDQTVSQASDVYWQELDILVNRKVRNDRVSMLMLEGKTDEEIIDWLKSNTTETNAILRDSFPSMPGPEGKLVPDFETGLNRRRQIIDDYMPDKSLRLLAVEGEVQIADLIKYQGWRNLPDIDGRVWADLDNGWQKFTTKIMHALGTVPEDVMVRHPFYRARFNDEMRRQIDLFDGKEIGPEELSAFRRASHEWALRSTRDTLYTVTRLSTPAYALRFVLPFFPAFESSMKFWTRQFIDKPVTLVRYAQLVNAPYAGGWVVDEDGNPVEDRRRSMMIPEALFRNGGGSVIVPWFGDKNSGKNIGTMRIPIASLNVILPGDYPWMPTADPLVQIPLSYIATRKPSAADAIATFEAFGVPIGDIVAKSSLPFGQPYDEKDFLDVATAAALPASAQRLITVARGESSTDFLRLVDEVYRTKMTNWEVNGRTGKYPDYEEAISDARGMMLFRAAASLTLPVSATPQSPYQFYIEESRRLDEKYAGDADGPAKADEEFINLYGTEYFRYTKSLSGSRGSGIDPTATAMSVYEDNKRLGGRIARLGERGDLLQMMTDGFNPDDEFSRMIYAAQQGAPIEGAPGRFLRGGPNSESIITGSAAEDAAQRDLGWREFENVTNLINAQLSEMGLTSIQSSPELQMIKQEAVAQIRDMYPAWGRDFDEFDQGRMTERLWTAQMMLSDENFMSKYGSAPHIQGLAEYMEVRQMFVDALAEADAAGGSADIEAASNADLRAIWMETQLMFLDPNRDPTWIAYYSRWLAKDPLKAIPAAPPNMIGGE